MKVVAASASRRNFFPHWRTFWIFPGGVALALPLGVAVAQGGTRRALALTFAGSLASIPLLRALFFRRISHGFLALEVPLLLVLVSNFVLRVRSAEDLADNPLDPAAQFRVALVLVALGLGGIALISPSHVWAESKLISRPLAIYAIYVVVVFLGAPLSVDPPLTLYRGLELAAAVVVLVGARKSVGPQASRRIEDLLYWFGVALLGSVWIGVALFPELALTDFQNEAVRWKFQVNGAVPAISSNGVGTLGLIVAVWSVARVAARRSRPTAGYLISILAVFTLAASQYRSGYVALVLAVGVWLLVQRRWGLATGLAAATVALVLLVPSAVTDAAPYVLRGQTTEEVEGLSSRLDWWAASIPVWQKSPLIGRGLLTGTRFEVLEPLGLTTTSSIHSTWVEALVGTGVIGLSLLLLLLLSLVRRAIREARRPGGWKAPLMLLVVLTVRSLTGSTFDSFSYFAVVVLWLASSIEEWPNFRRPVLRQEVEPAAS